jgi:acetylornithine deacetylase
MNTRELLERLVGFPTVSRDSNLALIDFVSGFLQARSAEVRLFASADARKANLFATLGPREVPGIMLSGHTDVVPVDGQSWSTNPFELTARAGAFYGRGAADMKGFIACALAAFDRAALLSLRTPLQLALSYDEEIGCVGVRSMIHDMASWPVRPKLCIVGEPTLMQVATGHKGKTAMRVACTGHSVHSALAPHGVNAIHLASDLVQRVRSLQVDIENSGARESGYDIPYSTLHVGIFRGGTALNIVPDRCDLELEIRTIAPDTPFQFVDAIRAHAAEIERQARRAHRDSGISIEITNEYPGLSVADDASIVEFVSELAGSSERIRVAYGSEAGLFTRIGIPTVLCGPGLIGHAHRADEYVTEEQISRCDAMMNRLLQTLV